MPFNELSKEGFQKREVQSVFTSEEQRLQFSWFWFKRSPCLSYREISNHGHLLWNPRQLPLPRIFVFCLLVVIFWLMSPSLQFLFQSASLKNLEPDVICPSRCPSTSLEPRHPGIFPVEPETCETQRNQKIVTRSVQRATHIPSSALTSKNRLQHTGSHFDKFIETLHLEVTSFFYLFRKDFFCTDFFPSWLINNDKRGL